MPKGNRSELYQDSECLECPLPDTYNEIRNQIQTIKDIIQEKYSSIESRVKVIEERNARDMSRLHDCEIDRKELFKATNSLETNMAVMIESLKPLKETRKWFIMMIIGFISLTAVTIVGFFK